MKEIAAFSSDQVSRLSDLSKDRLRYWNRIGFFRPEKAVDGAHRPFGRLYSFRDVVGLRVIAQVRARGVSLQELRKIEPWLKQHHETPWASLTLYLAQTAKGLRVHFADPAAGAIVPGRADETQIFSFQLHEI